MVQQQVALNAVPEFFNNLIAEIQQLMGDEIAYTLATPYQRKQAEYERATMPRISVGIGRLESVVDDPKGLNDLLIRVTWTVEVAQRLVERNSVGYSQITMWRIWDIADYLSGRLNRARLSAHEIGVSDVVAVEPDAPIAQTNLDHYSVLITGVTRLQIDAQRNLMTTEQFYSEFEAFGLDNPDAPIIESVEVDLETRRRLEDR